MVYIGLPSNPQFLGPQDPRDVAEVIASSVGPSGPNFEYLSMLEHALEGLGDGSEDEHVKDLAARVRMLMGVQDGQGKDANRLEHRRKEGHQVAKHAVVNEARRVEKGRGGRAVEETKKGLLYDTCD